MKKYQVKDVMMDEYVGLEATVEIDGKDYDIAEQMEEKEDGDIYRGGADCYYFINEKENPNLSDALPVESEEEGKELYKSIIDNMMLLYRIKEMEEKFGSVEFEGEKYILIQDAYLDGTEYVADAIKVSDEPDEDGYVPIFKVEWSIVYPDTEDAGDACDWENPAEVSAIGAKFNLEDGSVF